MSHTEIYHKRRYVKKALKSAELTTLVRLMHGMKTVKVFVTYNYIPN